MHKFKYIYTPGTRQVIIWKTIADEYWYYHRRLLVMAIQEVGIRILNLNLSDKDIQIRFKSVVVSLPIDVEDSDIAAFAGGVSILSTYIAYDVSGMDMIQ